MYFSDKQLAKKFGVHRTAIWRWVKKGDFPKPIKLSPGCTRWVDESIREWEQKKAKVAGA
jgi:prophage regulatory protein